jgi:hypothetical protein
MYPEQALEAAKLTRAAVKTLGYQRESEAPNTSCRRQHCG